MSVRRTTTTKGLAPLAIDLFCGLGGWTEGLLAEGYDVIGFDIERHRYPAHKNNGGPWFNIGSPGQKETNRNPVHELVGHKHRDQDGYERTHPDAFGWKVTKTSSHSQARKAASAVIAKIPFPLARHIARTLRPQA